MSIVRKKIIIIGYKFLPNDSIQRRFVSKNLIFLRFEQIFWVNQWAKLYTVLDDINESSWENFGTCSPILIFCKRMTIFSIFRGIPRLCKPLTLLNVDGLSSNLVWWSGNNAHMKFGGAQFHRLVAIYTLKLFAPENRFLNGLFKKEKKKRKGGDSIQKIRPICLFPAFPAHNVCTSSLISDLTSPTNRNE